MIKNIQQHLTMPSVLTVMLGMAGISTATYFIMHYDTYELYLFGTETDPIVLGVMWIVLGLLAFVKIGPKLNLSFMFISLNISYILLGLKISSVFRKEREILLNKFGIKVLRKFTVDDRKTKFDDLRNSKDIVWSPEREVESEMLCYEKKSFKDFTDEAKTLLQKYKLEDLAALKQAASTPEPTIWNSLLVQLSDPKLYVLLGVVGVTMMIAYKMNFIGYLLSFVPYHGNSTGRITRAEYNQLSQGVQGASTAVEHQEATIKALQIKVNVLEEALQQFVGVPIGLAQSANGENLSPAYEFVKRLHAMRMQRAEHHLLIGKLYGLPLPFKTEDWRQLLEDQNIIKTNE